MFFSKSMILGFSASVLLFLQPIPGGVQAAPAPQNAGEVLIFPKVNPEGNKDTLIDVKPGPTDNQYGDHQQQGYHRKHRHYDEKGRHGEWRSHGHHINRYDGWHHSQQSSGHGMKHSHDHQSSGHQGWRSHDHR